ncbi:hypothetical protein C8Q77DRAFT_1076862 [Trametes polyzona]|nr:hypothetical protein C8Q77DRAFT_1076862 [Trametes polyzona]
MFPSFARIALFSLLAAPAALALSSPSPVPLAPTRVRRAAAIPENDALNPAGVVVRSLPHNPSDLHGLTNAQRLARGLPPRSPALNTRRRALTARQSAAPCPLPQTTGTIRVTETATNNVLGFIGRQANNFGEYGVDGDAANALSVVLRRCESNDTPFDIETVNGLSGFPYLGAVVGFASTDDNLSADSFNYVYTAGTSQIPYGPAQNAPNAFSSASGTQKNAESAIWTLADDNTLTLNWVNTDGALYPAADAHLIYVESSQTFALTGNADQFQQTFGQVSEVTLTFVPAA